MQPDIFADYLRQAEPSTESGAVRALIPTGATRTMKIQLRYVEVYGLHQVVLNVDGISIFTKTYVTTENEQIGQIHL